MPLSILEETVTVTKSAPHERVISKRIIDRIVDVTVVTQRQTLPIKTVQKTLELSSDPASLFQQVLEDSRVCPSRSSSTKLLTFA